MRYKKPILDQNKLPISEAIDEILIKYCAALSEIERLNDKSFIERIKRILEREEQRILEAPDMRELKYHTGVCHGLKIALEQIAGVSEP